MQSCAPIEDSDETVQLHSLIRVFDRLSIGPTFFFQEEYLGSDQTARMQLYSLLSHQSSWELSGRVLDSRPKGRGFEPHRRHCVVSLSKTP